MPKTKAVTRYKMHVKKGDTVQVISGKDKGKIGEILQTLQKESKVLVKGVNFLQNPVFASANKFRLKQKMRLN